MDGAQGLRPYNIHEPASNKLWLDQNPNRVYCYFHAGMRVYDVRPLLHQGAGLFHPPTRKGCSSTSGARPMPATTEDCVVDDRGYIYMDTWHDGMYILRMKEDNKN